MNDIRSVMAKDDEAIVPSS